MAPMQRLSPGVYRGQDGGLVKSKTGMIPKSPKQLGVGAQLADKMANGQMQPTPMPRQTMPQPGGNVNPILGGIKMPGGSFHPGQGNMFGVHEPSEQMKGALSGLFGNNDQSNINRLQQMFDDYKKQYDLQSLLGKMG